jgi:hypothetical protein
MRINDLVNEQIIAEVHQEENLVAQYHNAEEYEGNISMSGRHLTSLRGAPKIVNGNFDVNENPLLKTLRFAPIHITGRFNANDCDIQSLRGCTTKTIGELFTISKNSFRSVDDLMGAPEDIGSLHMCFGMNFTSLSGIHKAFKCVNDTIFIPEKSTHVLALAFIKNLKHVVIGSLPSDQKLNTDLGKVIKILNDHLKTGSIDMLDVKTEIIETYSGQPEILALAKV